MRMTLFACKNSVSSGSWRFRSALLAFLLCGLSLFNLGGTGFASPTKHIEHHNALLAYTISGSTYDDYNQNGVQDTREPGLNGVVVTAYDANDTAVVSVISSTSNGIPGLYALNIPDGTGPVRIEFSNYGLTSTEANLALFQPSNHAGGTEEAFVSGTSETNTVNLGLEIPSEYCQNNPDVAVSCFTKGDQTNHAHTVVRFPYNATGDTTLPTSLAVASDVGTTFGMAYRSGSDTLFVSSYMRRHAGFKPSGSPGAIYSIDVADTNAPIVSATPFFDFNAPDSTITAGADPHAPGLDNYLLDASSFDAVGKVSLGGMALSEDQRFLFVMNLYDKKLYTIYIGQASSQPAATAVAGYPLPRPADCVQEDDFRPFAVATYRDSEYVGAVCSAESTISAAQPKGDSTQLRAYVYKYTLGNGFVSTPVLDFPLNYPRHCANDSSNVACVTNNSANWNPWTPTYQVTDPTSSYPSYPQPMLTGIAFDRGDMILALRDRFGDQTGYNTPTPDYSSYSNGIPSGDVLRACLATPEDPSGGWTLERNASCGGIQTAGADDAKGPGNGEYYYQNTFPAFYDHVGSGSVLQVPGFSGSMSTVFDPTDTVFSGGVRTYDNSTGGTSNRYRIYASSLAGAESQAPGLGGMAAFCHAAPVEIGHRIWFDVNGNGIQDADEPPIPNVTVHLYSANGTTLLQTTTTDSNGEYFFTVQPYVNYVMRIDNPADYAGSNLLAGSSLTAANQGSDSLASSKAILPFSGKPIGTDNYPFINVSPLLPGGNVHTYDIGFVPLPDLPITKAMLSEVTR